MLDLFFILHFTYLHTHPTHPSPLPTGLLTMLSKTSLLNLSGEGKKRRGGNGWNLGGAITGDGEWTEEENQRDWHPPHVTSPPTFQPWLHLWWQKGLYASYSTPCRTLRLRFRPCFLLKKTLLHKLHSLLLLHPFNGLFSGTTWVSR